MARRQKRTERRYTSAEWDMLRNRVFKLTCSDYWTTHVIKCLSILGIDPHTRNLRRLIARKGIYPPPAEHTPHQSCCCINCLAVRTFPRHMAPRGIAYECFLEERAVLEERLDPEIRAEIDRLRGGPPGVVVDARARKADRMRRLVHSSEKNRRSR